MSDYIPPGMNLRFVFRVHKEKINKIAWSLDGKLLAVPSDDHTVSIWNIDTGLQHVPLAPVNNTINCVAWSQDTFGMLLALGGINTLSLWNTRSIYDFTINSTIVYTLAWSPDGKYLAYGSNDQQIRIWEKEKEHVNWISDLHAGAVNAVAWSPDGKTLASGSDDRQVRIWELNPKIMRYNIKEHTGAVHCVAWSPDGKILASGSSDATIRIWDVATGHTINILEGHTAPITAIAFSYDGHLLASKSHDGTVRIWRSDTWESIVVLQESASSRWNAGLAFHPKKHILASLGEKDTIIRIWDLNLTTLLDSSPTNTVRYANAKVVLVGDSGVGKSGLGIVLSGENFIPTESTHGRHIWTFDSQEVKLSNDRRETHETLLWDLAGQPGYRLIHQLHLNEVAIALVVFDSRSEVDSFAGVRHWDRALRQAYFIQGSGVLPMKKFLVAARVDRGGRGVSQTRIASILQELNFDGYFETSAKEGLGIIELIEAIKNSIDWKALPKVSSTDLFQNIREFLINEKKNGRILSTNDDLYRAFLQFQQSPNGSKNLQSEFDTCIGRVESRGLIRKLSFGNLVLLQPELLDAYASALVTAVKDEPEGLGSIAEENAQSGSFYIPSDERIKDKEQEKLLLIAMVEDLLRHEIALRERANDGVYLVFPSQPTRESPDFPNPEGKGVMFKFEGPTINIYATLAVRLSHSGFFNKEGMWKNAITYTTRLGGICGMFLRQIKEGQGELTLFFDKTASDETCFHFEEYVHTHLKRKALPQSIHRQRIFVCLKCDTPFTNIQIERRLKSGSTQISCSVCGTKVSILEKEAKLSNRRTSLVLEMDQIADKQREHEADASVRQGLQNNIELNPFDTFLCYNSEDRLLIRDIAEKLKERGILPWFDEWQLQPGLPWQRLLEQQITQIKSVAVFVGESGIGPWQHQELDAFIREFVRCGSPVIPVILPNISYTPLLPIFLKGMTWVDFRKNDPVPIDQLIWGITGKNTSSSK